MTDTWSVFTTTDLLTGLLGAVGFLSMIVVIATATSRVDKRENDLRIARVLQAQSQVQEQEEE